MMKYLTVHRKLLWLVSLVIVSRCLFVTLFAGDTRGGIPTQPVAFSFRGTNNIFRHNKLVGSIAPRSYPSETYEFVRLDHHPNHWGK